MPTSGTMTHMDNLRRPYVGEGIDGALRSAAIDESEADTLDRADPRLDDVLASARRWREQAAWLQAQHGDTIAAAAAAYDHDEDTRRALDGAPAYTALDLADEEWDAIADAVNPLLDDGPSPDTHP